MRVERAHIVNTCERCGEGRVRDPFRTVLVVASKDRKQRPAGRAAAARSDVGPAGGRGSVDPHAVQSVAGVKNARVLRPGSGS